MAQPYPYPFQYAQLPTYHWQTFDRNAVSFSFHPIIPPERIHPSNSFADDQMKPEDDTQPLTEDNPDPPPSDVPADADSELNGISSIVDALTCFLDVVTTGDEAAAPDADAEEVKEGGEPADSPDKGTYYTSQAKIVCTDASFKGGHEEPEAMADDLGEQETVSRYFRSRCFQYATATARIWGATPYSAQTRL
jgi:hypothetical protein